MKPVPSIQRIRQTKIKSMSVGPIVKRHMFRRLCKLEAPRSMTCSRVLIFKHRGEGRDRKHISRAFTHLQHLSSFPVQMVLVRERVQVGEHAKLDPQAGILLYVQPVRRSNSNVGAVHQGQKTNCFKIYLHGIYQMKARTSRCRAVKMRSAE